jgi:hypothetical protein
MLISRLPASRPAMPRLLLRWLGLRIIYYGLLVIYDILIVSYYSARNGVGYGLDVEG